MFRQGNESRLCAPGIRARGGHGTRVAGTPRVIESRPAGSSARKRNVGGGLESTRAARTAALPHRSAGTIPRRMISRSSTWAARALANDAAPDLLINNAAVLNRLAPRWEQDDREFTRLVDANIRGVQTFSTG